MHLLQKKIQKYGKKFSFLRMYKESVLDLVQMLRPHLTGIQKHCISYEFQVLIALRYYEDGSYQRSVGQDCLYPVSQPTVSKVLRRVTNGLCSLSEQFMKFPNTPEKRLDVTEK